MAYKFCPRCGSRLCFLSISGSERLVCPECDFIFYQNPIPAAAAVIVQYDKVCLVKRKIEPAAGCWAFPAGYMELNESIEAAAVREAREETNLNVRVIKLLDVKSAYENQNAPQVVVAFYLCEYLSGELQAGDDAAEAGFFRFDELPSPMAFETHKRVLQAVHREMQTTPQIS
jgi:ADP-ribose pyrophosphatase YjhB (NUDIX family)